MAVFKVGLCDDEKAMLKINNRFLKEIDDSDDEFQLDIVNFLSGKDIISYVKNNVLDIAILDIDLLDMTGIELAQKLYEINPNIVLFFLTSHSEFALEAYDVEAIGYVLKPVDKVKLQKVLKKAIVQARAKRELVDDRTLIITEENVKKKIIVNDIRYIERYGAQCIIYTKDTEHKVYDTITNLTDELGEGFIRVSQSFLVKISEIDKVTYKDVTLKDGSVFSLGRAYTKTVKMAYLEESSK